MEKISTGQTADWPKEAAASREYEKINAIWSSMDDRRAFAVWGAGLVSRKAQHSKSCKDEDCSKKIS